MQRELSIYLDFMRLFAAIWVLLAHMGNFGAVGPDISAWLPASGRDAVVIFFVLSGFVIAYTCYQRDKGLLDYVASRAGRIYSVAFPVLILTVCCDMLFMKLGADLNQYPLYQYESLHIYIPFHLMFGGEIWFLSEQPFTNGPYWSLGYEVWYYVLFGCYFYFNGWKQKLLCLGLLSAVGFKLLLLLPVWWAGVWLFKHVEYFRISKNIARILFWFSIGFYFIFVFSPLQSFLMYLPSVWIGEEYSTSFLGSAKKFLSDYIVCIIFVVNVVAFKCSEYSLEKFASVIQQGASYTFIAYLAHGPIFKNIGAFFDYDKNSPLAFLIILVVTFIFIWLLGQFTERKKRHFKIFFLDTLVLLKRLFLGPVK